MEVPAAGWAYLGLREPNWLATNVQVTDRPLFGGMMLPCEIKWDPASRPAGTHHPLRGQCSPVFASRALGEFLLWTCLWGIRFFITASILRSSLS